MLVRYLKAEVLVNCSLRGEYHDVQGAQTTAIWPARRYSDRKIDHEYQPGDLIPSERELAERFGLSRSTVRLAIQELEYLGRIVRKQGRGTFVADRLAQATNLTQSYSFTEQMKAMGRLPETTILEFCEMEADKTLSMQWGFIWVKRY